MDPRYQSGTNNSEKLKRHTFNFRPRNGRINIGMDGTWSIEGTPQTQPYLHVFRQHANIGMERKMAAKTSKVELGLLRSLALQKIEFHVPSTASQDFIHSSLTARARLPWRHVQDYMACAYHTPFISTYMAHAYYASFISTYGPCAYHVPVISMTPHTLE